MDSVDIITIELFDNSQKYVDLIKTSFDDLYINVFSILQNKPYIEKLRLIEVRLTNHLLFFLDLFLKIKNVNNKTELYNVIKYYFKDNVDNEALFGYYELTQLLANICSNCLFVLIHTHITKLDINKLSNKKIIELGQNEMRKIINDIDNNLIDYVENKY